MRPYAFDMSSAVHSRSPSQRSPDGFLPAFSVSLTTPAIVPEQHPVVWTPSLHSGSEGPTLISCAARLLQVSSYIATSFSRRRGAPSSACYSCSLPTMVTTSETTLNYRSIVVSAER